MLMLLLALHPAQAAKNLNVEQSQLIEAPAAVVWQYVANFETWKDWTVWNTERDPEAEWTYGGEAGKAGHSSEWAGKELGKGRMVATEVEPEAVWNYDLYFGSSARSYPGGLTLEESDGTTLVTWSWNMKMSGLGKALFGNRVADKVAQDFAGGLDGLELAVDEGKGSRAMPRRGGSWPHPRPRAHGVRRHPAGLRRPRFRWRR